MRTIRPHGFASHNKGELPLKIARYAPLAALMLLFIAASAHAQGGGVDCTDSPEASTDVLMLVGSVGMVHGSLFLKKFVRRLRSR